MLHSNCSAQKEAAPGAAAGQANSDISLLWGSLPWHLIHVAFPINYLPLTSYPRQGPSPPAAVAVCNIWAALPNCPRPKDCGMPQAGCLVLSCICSRKGAKLFSLWLCQKTTKHNRNCFRVTTQNVAYFSAAPRRAAFSSVRYWSFCVRSWLKWESTCASKAAAGACDSDDSTN